MYLELGIAIGLGKPFFLIRDRNAQIPPVLTSLALYAHSGSFRTMRREQAEQVEEYDFAAVQFTQETTKQQILPQYLVVAGESFDDEDVVGGKGEIVLDSAERIPVQVIGSANIIPTPHAVRSGQWTPLDDYFSIRDTDLTPEQAKRACYFVQPLTEMGIKAPASNT